MADRSVAVRGRIEKRVQLSAALVKDAGYTPESYARVVLNALVRNPKLAECDGGSLDTALLVCIESRLVPDGVHAAIVPFKGRAQAILMVDGKAALARRALPGLSLRARVVYAGDKWNHSEGLHAELEHYPNPEASHSDDQVVAAYAIAEFSGGHEWVWMYRGDLDRARNFSRARSGPWSSHFPEMCEKTVMHRLLKRLPRIPGAPPDWDEVDTEPERGEQIVKERVREEQAEAQEVVATQVAGASVEDVEPIAVDDAGASDAFDESPF